MTEPRYADITASLLRRGLADVGSIAEHAEPDVVQQMEAAITARSRSRARRGHAMVAGAALFFAATGFLTVLGMHKSKSKVVPTPATESREHVAIVVGPTFGPDGMRLARRASNPSARDEGDLLGRGSLIATAPGERTELSLSTGTRLELREQGELRVVETSTTERFFLRKGALRADVAKLSPGDRFIVTTPDAEVEVHGTSFLVELLPPDPSCPGMPGTRVTVYRGVVTVRADRLPEARVAAGQQWPAPCSSRPSAPPVMSVAAAPPPAQSGFSKRAAPPAQADSRDGSAEPTGGRSPSSNAAWSKPERSARAVGPAKRGSGGLLSEQNVMFARAMAKKRQGDTEGAVSELDRLVARYPSTQLLESALAEKMQILRSVDRARARAAASDYLRAFPDGFARELATALRSESP